MNAHTLKTKWDEFLDAYLEYIADPTPARQEALARQGEELQELDPEFSYADFWTKLANKEHGE
jgi:hypothetical protein